MVRGKSLLLGFVIGGVVSASATLLSAPSSGRDLRSRAKVQSTEWKDMISNLKFDGMRLKQQITDTSKEGAALIKDLTQEIKKSVQDWQETVEPHQENIQKYLEQIESSLKDLEEKVKNQ
ncbi:YtxH domain-containing protein [Virgibacillus flavescens]|uniref:YtxH domain-containing protein n=1 Tax=Virgibacillus flavescens TaxID=1611422 RepID=UPI003D329855